MALVLVVFVLFAIAVGLVLALAAAGRARWGAETKLLRERIEAARAPAPATAARFDARELERVPAPVARFLRAAIAPGRPIACAAQFSHSGTFAVADDRWAPFTSDQRVVTQRPGFDWDARIELAPGVAMHVHDAYAGGEGRLHAAVGGLVTVMRSEGGVELAQGELMRYLAEAAWVPTALLPSQGVAWSPIDDRSARATLEDAGLAVSLTFRFDEDDRIEVVESEARPRLVQGKVVPTPWRGRFWNHEERDGMVIPLDAEVAWLLPEGERPYWRGHVTQIVYEDAT